MLETYGAMLFRLALFITRDSKVAQIAVQRTLASLLRSNPWFEKESHRRMWLIRELTGRNYHAKPQLAEDDPALRALSPEQKAHIYRVMKEPLLQRVAFVLYYGEQLTLVDMGECLYKKPFSLAHIVAQSHDEIEKEQPDFPFDQFAALYPLIAPEESFWQETEGLLQKGKMPKKPRRHPYVLRLCTGVVAIVAAVCLILSQSLTFTPSRRYGSSINAATVEGRLYYQSTGTREGLRMFDGMKSFSWDTQTEAAGSLVSHGQTIYYLSNSVLYSYHTETNKNTLLRSFITEAKGGHLTLFHADGSILYFYKTVYGGQEPATFYLYSLQTHEVKELKPFDQNPNLTPVALKDAKMMGDVICFTGYDLTSSYERKGIYTMDRYGNNLVRVSDVSPSRYFIYDDTIYYQVDREDHKDGDIYTITTDGVHRGKVYGGYCRIYGMYENLLFFTSSAKEDGSDPVSLLLNTDSGAIQKLDGDSFGVPGSSVFLGSEQGVYVYEYGDNPRMHFYAYKRDKSNNIIGLSLQAMASTQRLYYVNPQWLMRGGMAVGGFLVLLLLAAGIGKWRRKKS